MITQTDIANMMIAANGTPTMASIIKEIIDHNDIVEMQDGVDYYNNKNAILDRKIYYWKDNQKVIDDTSPNNRVPNNYHKILVRQKMGYLVGKPITFSDKEVSTDDEGNKNSPNEEFLSQINDILGEKWDDIANELVKGSANKGVEWLHLYIDEDGRFGYTIIDARQIIPIWETQKQEELDAVIRYYVMNINGEDRIRAEYWTDQDVTYYLENEQENFEPDPTIEVNPQSHFTHVREIDEERIETGLGWGKVPFIPFKNNEEMTPDLNDYKKLIDIYDKIFADGANNIEEIQDVIWVLKNYQGTGLEEFQDNLRKYKALKTDENGGVDTETVEIPTEAREKFLDRTEENIYTFGMGVDVSTDKFGNNPTGVALQFLYALLDLKCDTTERKFKRAIMNLLEFISDYFKFVDNKEYDPGVVKVTFNRSMLTNESEKVESAQKSKGVISDETIAANHPWVDEPEKEIERLEEQRAANDIYSSRLERDLNNIARETEGVEL